MCMSQIQSRALSAILQRFESSSKATKNRAHLMMRLAAASVFDLQGATVPKETAALPGIRRSDSRARLT
jgi:hypothetical protein